MTELNGNIFIGMCDTDRKGVEIGVFITEQIAKDFIGNDELAQEYGLDGTEELFDHVNSNLIDGIYSMEVKKHELNILDFAKIPEREDGLKPYLFLVENRYGEYTEEDKILCYTNDPDTEMKRIAQEHRDGEYDESHNGYWFDGQNLTIAKGYKEITPQEAIIFSISQSL